MLKSNRIEGEDRLNPRDEEAVEFALDTGLVHLNQILTVHEMLGEYLKVDWNGEWREWDVIVGKHQPPIYQKVPKLMNIFAKHLPKIDSWTAHNEFEKIHPFADLNGRTGRLIWLTKAVKEGYRFEIPFLQMYYYQTLEHWG